MDLLTYHERKALAGKRRIEFFLSRGGRCDECEAKLVAPKYEIDHIVALCFGGSNDDGNLRLLCEDCHKIKTRRDVKANAKSKRLQAGRKVSRRPMPFGRLSGLKKKLSGQIVPRHAEQTAAPSSRT